MDGLLQAYGTVVYLHCIYNDATVSSWLLASKFKVAPLKLMTVPRLELAFNACTRTIHATRNILFRQQGCIVVDSGPGQRFRFLF